MYVAVYIIIIIWKYHRQELLVVTEWIYLGGIITFNFGWFPDFRDPLDYILFCM